MEFFYAHTLWSGGAHIITNVYQILQGGRFFDMKNHHHHYLAEIFLCSEEREKLADYLSDEYGDTFEKKLELYFYGASPVDCWFDLERFVKVCKEIGISPKMRFYKQSFVSETYV